MKKAFLCTLLSCLFITTGAQSRFRLNVIGDVQVRDAQEFEYADKSLFRELSLRPGNEINLFLGDQVNDKPDLMEDFRDRLGLLPQESWVAIGNHDRDVDPLRTMQEATFNRVFGPSFYAKRKGRWHFLVLNNVHGTGLRDYEGRLPAEQLSFIKEYVSRLGRKDRLVLAMHIPLAATANRDEILETLRGRGDVLVLSGHLHEIGRQVLRGEGVTVHEVTAGAASGIWWRGELDWDGVPMAIMQEGAPRGYFVFDFTRKGYSFRYKGVGLDEDRRMSVSVSGANGYDKEVDSLKARPRGTAYATIFGAFEGTVVRYRVDDGPWMLAQKAATVDANVARIRHLNKTISYPSQFSKREPLRTKPSGYVWRMPLPEGLAPGAHRLRIVAEDPYGFSAEDVRMFQQ